MVSPVLWFHQAPGRRRFPRGVVARGTPPGDRGDGGRAAPSPGGTPTGVARESREPGEGADPRRARGAKEVRGRPAVKAGRTPGPHHITSDITPAVALVADDPVALPYIAAGVTWRNRHAVCAGADWCRPAGPT